MKTAVCVVARYENDYLLEWIHYHLSLGFDGVILYDNNDIGDDSIYTLINDNHLDKVTVIDYRGRKSFQLEAYNSCHQQFKDTFDWIAYIDADEFITFGTEQRSHDIHAYLSEANDADVIEINWMTYGDNDQVYQKEGGVLERFPRPISESHPINKVVKSIVNTKARIKFVRNPHVVDGTELKIVDDCFNILPEANVLKEVSYKKLYLRHYKTKTIEEFIKIRM